MADAPRRHRTCPQRRRIGKRFRRIDKLGGLVSVRSTEKRVTVATVPRAETAGFLQYLPFARVQFGWDPMHGA